MTTVAADVRLLIGIAPLFLRRPIILRIFCTFFSLSRVSAAVVLLSVSTLRTA